MENEVSAQVPVESIPPLPENPVNQKSQLKTYLSVSFMVAIIILVVTLVVMKFAFGVKPGIEKETTELVEQQIVITVTPFVRNEPSVVVQNPSSISIGTESSTPSNQTISVDDKWSMYKNFVKHYQVKLPKQVFLERGNCVSGKFKDALVPLKVSEASDSSYVTVDYFYEIAGDSCNKYDNNSLVIKNRLIALSNGLNPYIPKYWKIIVDKAETDTDLLKYVQQHYGNGCRIGDKKMKDENTFDVKILGDGLGMDQTKCPINYITVLKYSPTLKLLANWDLGQSVSFAGENYNPAYDTSIVDSFVFVP